MRTNKIKVLQEALSGNVAGLRPLQLQRRKEAMPYREVHGLIDIRQVPALLLDIEVMPTESIIDGKRGDYLSLRDCIGRFDLTGWATPHYSYSAVGSIYADDPRFDEVVLNYVHIRRADYSVTYLPSATIGELRRQYSQCRDSVDLDFILLDFESDPARLSIPQQLYEKKLAQFQTQAL